MSMSEPTLMGLPREIRDCIYGYLWSAPNCVKVAGNRHRGKQHTASVEPYPPRRPGTKFCEDGETFPRPDTYMRNVDEDGDNHTVPGVAGRAVSNVDLNKNGVDTHEGCTSVDNSLLYVSRQLSAEATLVFYKNSTLVLNMDGVRSMKYLRRLSDIARANITSIAITSELLYDRHIPSIQAWSGDKERPVYEKDGLILITPFAKLMVEELPRLSELFFHVPIGGLAPLYCGWARRELHMMLKYGRLKKLHHVFGGKSAADAMGSNESQACYHRLMGTLADGRELVEHEFELRRPVVCMTHGDSMQRRRTQEWQQARQDYVREHARPFAWEWGDRGIDMHAGMSVQAVISCTPAGAEIGGEV